MFIKVIKQEKWKIILGIVILFHLFALSRLIFFPYPELFIYSYLTERGLLPYAQILDQHFPGLMFFPLNLASLDMTTPQIARIWHLGLVFLTQALLYLTAQKLFKSEKWALFVCVFYLIWQPFFEGYVLWIDTFVTPILLAASYFFIKWRQGGEKKDLFWIGVFLGLSLLFKQVVLPLITIVVFFTWREAKRVSKMLPLLMGISTFSLFLIIYILRLGVWNDFVYWTVMFNLTTFSGMGRKYPDLSGLIKSLPLFGGAIGGMAYLFLYQKSKDIVSLSLFFLGSLMFAYARFDFIHLQPALPFAILITALFLIRSNKRYQLSALLVYFLASTYLLLPFYKTNIGNRVLFFGEYERAVSEKVGDLADPNDTVFAMATFPHLYQMTETLPPGNIFVFQFPWFMVEAQDRVLAGLESDRPRVVVRDGSATTGGLNLVSYMRNIDNFVDENYKVVDKVGGTEILVPK